MASKTGGLLPNTWLMASLPKPLIGLLLGTVAFFAIWMVALKPSSSSSSGSGSQGGVGQYQSAINAAHGAVTTSGQANAKLGAPTATAPAAKPATPVTPATPATPAKTTAVTPAKPSTPAKSAVKPAKAVKSAKAVTHAPAAAPSAAAAVATVQNAIAAHKVLAILFYNPAAADDQAMKSELAALPTHGGKVVKVAVPVAELTKFGMVTQQVPVVTAPTLAVIDASRHATTITGFADQLEISQRIDDALAAK